MHSKWLITLMLLAVLAVYIYFNIPGNQTSQDFPSKENPELQLNQKQQLKTDLTQSIGASTEEQAVISEQQKLLLNEIENRLFSNDPLVELASLELLLGHCRKSFQVANLFIASEPNKQQQEVLDAVHQQCQEYQNSYPKLLSTAEGEAYKAFKPSSQLGQLLNQFDSNQQYSQVEMDEQNQLTLYHALREQNSALIMTMGIIHKWSGRHLMPLNKLLNTNDMIYVRHTSHMALTLMACDYQNGRVCEPTSQMMLLMCIEQPSACGMDYPNWYQQNTLPGMQQDVATLTAYYSQISQ